MMIVRLGVVLLSLALGSTAVHAGKRRVLVVPTELGGYFLNRDIYRRDVDIALEDRLRAAQFVVARASALSPAEAECREFQCLTRIAETHGVALVVAGLIVNNQKIKVSYHLRVRIAEKTNGKAAVTREREKDCDNCSESQARDALATLMSAVIANDPEPPAPQNLPPPSPIASPEPVVQPPRSVEPPPKPPVSNGHIVEPPPPPLSVEDHLSRRTRLVFRGVGFGLVGLGILGLIQGGVEKAHDGELGDRNMNGGCASGCAYRYVTTEGQALFFSLGTVAFLGGAAMAIVSWVPLPKPRRAGAFRLLPEVSPVGARLQLELTF